jgi:FixJ family two-component response regulator
MNRHDLVTIVDDDADVRESIEMLLRSGGHNVRSFASPAAFLADGEADATSCLILDVQLGDANGLDFQQELLENEIDVPVILISGHGDIPMSVRAMRAGAVTFLSKPFDEEELLAAVAEGFERNERRRKRQEADLGLRDRVASLTPRERDVLGLVTAGLMNKQVAARLSLSEITVKIHRGNMMRKMKAESLADLVRMAEALGIREATSRYSH